MGEYDELKTPEERRKWIEALHASTPAGRDSARLRAAIGDIRAKPEILRIAKEVLKSDPVERDGSIVIGRIELIFGQDDQLSSIGTWPNMIGASTSDE
jgi:hypothetical protein